MRGAAAIATNDGRPPRRRARCAGCRRCRAGQPRTAGGPSYSVAKTCTMPVGPATLTDPERWLPCRSRQRAQCSASWFEDPLRGCSTRRARRLDAVTLRQTTSAHRTLLANGRRLTPGSTTRSTRLDAGMARGRGRVVGCGAGRRLLQRGRAQTFGSDDAGVLPRRSSMRERPQLQQQSVHETLLHRCRLRSQRGMRGRCAWRASLYSDMQLGSRRRGSGFNLH